MSRTDPFHQAHADNAIASQPVMHPPFVQKSSSTSRDDGNCSSSNCFVVSHLYRHSLEVPWGLVLSMVGDQEEDGLVIISDVTQQQQHTTSTRWVQTTGMVYSTIDPSRIRRGTINPNTFAHYIVSSSSNRLQLPRPAAMNSNHQNFSALPVVTSEPPLLPGDCLLSINGIPLCQFHTLSQVTQCLRSCRQLVLVVWRNAVACLRAQEALTQDKHQQKVLRGEQVPSRNYGSFSSPVTVSSLPQPPTAVFASAATVLRPPHWQAAVQAFSVLRTNFGGRKGAAAVPTTRKTQQPTTPLVAIKEQTKKQIRTPKKVRRLEEKQEGDRQKMATAGGSHIATPKKPQHGQLKQLNAGPTNPWFRNLLKGVVVNDPACHKHFDQDSSFLPYCDNEFDSYDPDEGRRAYLFILNSQGMDTNAFATWLQQRKQTWRSTRRERLPLRHMQKQQQEHNRLRKVYEHDDDDEDTWWKNHHCSEYEIRKSSAVAIDFWSGQGYNSFQHWLVSSSAKWKQSYSWNREKRRKLEQDCEEVVHLVSSNFDEWLRVRKNQWRVLRRKRQRERFIEQQRQESADIDDVQVILEHDEHDCDACTAETKSSMEVTVTPTFKSCNVKTAKTQYGMRSSSRPVVTPSLTPKSLPASPKSVFSMPQQKQSEFILIDALLEEQEREQKARNERPPLNITQFFDFQQGCPDDVLVHCLRFLKMSEYVKLLAISRKLRQSMIQREEVWKQLCPSHWKLPRRPRKPWHIQFLTLLRDETESWRKRWDDLLTKISYLLIKGDQVQTIEKLVTKAETSHGFCVNYCSAVVCERNSILNLAVIHSRHKVVKWLVEKKGADISTADRGNFTPLLNAAWNGDRYLVRYFLQKGADRTTLGTSHYTKGLSPPDFKGRTAEGWAEHRGHVEIAKLIRMGI